MPVFPSEMHSCAIRTATCRSTADACADSATPVADFHDLASNELSSAMNVPTFAHLQKDTNGAARISWMRMKGLLRCATVFAGASSQALACTLCDSNTAEQVRSAVLSDFWRNVGVSLIPFAIMFVIAALIHGREARGTRHE